MFTGLIQEIGRVESLQPRGNGGARLNVRTGNWQEPPRAGESIAVQGVCLTVTSGDNNRLGFDLLRETLASSNLGQRRTGDPVNLERALRAGDRLGGHLVSGHIDGQGICAGIANAGPDRVLTIKAERALLSGVVVKGSVACDGISLTVADAGPESFTVYVIPHTWNQTTLRWLRQGDAVNLETDLMGKYAAARGQAASSRSGAILLEDLRRCGFME